MAKRNKNGNIDPEDIFRYTGNGMPDEERNALERELQKDPFVEEALEGLSTLSADEAKQDIMRLKGRLDKRIGKRNTLTWIRIAASVIVIVAVGSILFSVITGRMGPPGQIAMDSVSEEKKSEALEMEKVEEPANAPESTEEGEFETETAQEKAFAYQPEPATSEGTGREETAESSQGTEPVEVGSREAVVSPVLPEAEPITEDETAAAEILAFEEEMTIVEEPSPAEDSFALAAYGAEALEEKMAEALPGVETERRSEIARTAALQKTAADEKAKKQAGESQIHAELHYRFLDEVAAALPEQGNTAFNNYLAENMVFPAVANLDETAEVKLNFSLNDSGNPTDITVEESPSDAFSREAIRLINEGPLWIPVSGVYEANLRINLALVFRK